MKGHFKNSAVIQVRYVTNNLITSHASKFMRMTSTKTSEGKTFIWDPIQIEKYASETIPLETMFEMDNIDKSSNCSLNGSTHQK